MSSIKIGSPVGSVAPTAPPVGTVAPIALPVVEGVVVPAGAIEPVASPFVVGFSPNLVALNQTISNAQNTIELQQRSTEDKRVLIERVTALIATLGKPEVKAAEPMSAPELDPGPQFRALSLTATPAEWHQAFAELEAPPKVTKHKDDLPPLLAALSGGDVQTAQKHLPKLTELKAIMDAVRVLHPEKLKYVGNLKDKDSAVVRKADDEDEDGTTISRVKIPGPDIVALERALPKTGWLSESLAAGADIDSLVTLMMMEMEKDATRDLRDMLVEMKGINAKKQAMRDRIQYTKEQQTKLSGDMHKRYDERTKLKEGDPRRIDRNKVSYEQFESSQMATLVRGSLQDDEFALAVSPNEQNYNQKPPPEPKPVVPSGAAAPGSPPAAAPLKNPADEPYSKGLNHGQAVLAVAKHFQQGPPEPGELTDAQKTALVDEARAKAKASGLSPEQQKRVDDVLTKLLQSLAGLARYSGNDALESITMGDRAKQSLRELLATLPPAQRAAAAQYAQLVIVKMESDVSYMANPPRGRDQDSDVPDGSSIWDLGVDSRDRDNIATLRYEDGKEVEEYEDMSGKWGNFREFIGNMMRGGFLNAEIEGARKELAPAPPPAPAKEGPFDFSGFKDQTPLTKLMKDTKQMQTKSHAGAALREVKDNAQYAELPQVSVNQLSMRQVSDYIDKLNGDKDSLSELSETMSLRLQMYQDRRSKFVSTLSNLLKKQSETSAGIVGNLK